MAEITFSTSDDLKAMPVRCAIIALDGVSGAFLNNVPMFATATFQRRSAPPTPIHTSVVALGVLATDHVGYASWDLEPLRIRLAGALDPGVTLALTSIAVEVSGPLGERLELLNEEAIGGDILVHRFFADPAAVHRLESGAVPAMQTPSLGDWYVSPASFSYLPAELVGSGGCETLLPSNVSTNTYRATQLIVPTDDRPITLATTTDWVPPSGHIFGVEWFKSLGMTDSAADGVQKENTPPKPSAVDEVGIMLSTAEFARPFEKHGRLGTVITYDITWIPVGHGLGQLVYSLPLAPGEMTRIAVVDWARSVTASRDETIRASDALTHTQLRDRSIDEVVSSSASEFQGGGSLLGTIANVAATVVGTAAGGPVGGVAANRAASSLGLGFAASLSGGDRDIAAHTTSKLADSIQQHSTMLRDLRSTVVVQSTQRESGTASSRVVRNYNHSHAMTILYYEVLRHHRVVVRADQGRPAVLLRRPLALFNPSTVVTHRLVLERMLVDPELRAGFALVEKLVAYAMLKQAPVQDAAAAPIVGFELKMFIGKLHNPGVFNSYKASLGLLPSGGVGGVAKLLRSLDQEEELSQGSMGEQGDVWNIMSVGIDATMADGRGTPDPLTWRQLSGPLIVTVKPGNRDEDTHLWVEEVVLTAVTKTGARQVVAHSTSPSHLTGVGAYPITVPVVSPPAIPEDVAPLERISVDERMLVLRLLGHLNSNRAHYWRQIWLHEDPNARLLANAKAMLTVEGTTVPLFSVIENHIVDVVGDESIFFLDPEVIKGIVLPRVIAHSSERLVSLPTRGVFAEAKLGHCNASEFIDDRRFWDWQKSPIPDSAESPPSLSGRAADPALAATALGPPGVSVVNAPNAPDPVGMAAMLNVLGKGDLFRDSSMSSQVADAVKAAVAGAVSAVAAPSVSEGAAPTKKPETPNPKSDEHSPAAPTTTTGAAKPTDGENTKTPPSPTPPSGSKVVPKPAYSNPRAFKTVSVVFVRDGSVPLTGFFEVTITSKGPGAGSQPTLRISDASEGTWSTVPVAWTQVTVTVTNIKARTWAIRSDAPLFEMRADWKADIVLDAPWTTVKFNLETDESVEDVQVQEGYVKQVMMAVSRQDETSLSTSITPKIGLKDVFEVALQMSAAEKETYAQSASSTVGETYGKSVTMHLKVRKVDPFKAAKFEVIKS